jgi:hypothetical protein
MVALWIVLGFILLTALLLLVPVRYIIAGHVGDETDVSASISALFFKKTFTFEGLKQLGEQPDAAPSEPPAQKKMKTKAMHALTKHDPKIIMTLGVKFLHKIFRKLKPKKISVRGIIGFDDLFYAGCFAGLYEAVTCAAGLRESVDLQFDTEKKCIALDFEVAGRLSIGSVLGPVLWLVWKLFKER